MIWAFKVNSPFSCRCWCELSIINWAKFKWLNVVWGLKGNSQGSLFPANGWWRMFISPAMLGGEEINWKLLCKHVRGVTDAWAALFSKHRTLLYLFLLKYFKSHFPAVKCSHVYWCATREIFLLIHKNSQDLNCLFIFMMSVGVFKKQTEGSKWKNICFIWNAVKQCSTCSH